ncbi:hypothetical protein [Streptomyces sp. NPDC090994]|uniref:hypothetical protein n=1 Tax=Streptomyces sp. NPDC090994 TaxID=3365969 RepID=UPI00380779BB
MALVLDEDAPLPETARDVEDLVSRLRGHVVQLGPFFPAGSPVLTHAQRMSASATPEEYVPSRVHLVRLAEEVQHLAEEARHSVQVSTSAPVCPWARPNRHAVRLAVFALALGTVVMAASVPRDAAAQTAASGTAWVAVIVGVLTVLLALGHRPPQPPPRVPAVNGRPVIAPATQPGGGTDPFRTERELIPTQQASATENLTR